MYEEKTFFHFKNFACSRGFNRTGLFSNPSGGRSYYKKAVASVLKLARMLFLWKKLTLALRQIRDLLELPWAVLL